MRTIRQADSAWTWGVDLTVTGLSMLFTAGWIVLQRPEPFYALLSGTGFGALGAGIIAAALAQVALKQAMLLGVPPAALDPVLDLSPRRMRRALEMACSFAVCARRGDVRVEDVRQALALTERVPQRAPIGFVSPRSGTAG